MDCDMCTSRQEMRVASRVFVAVLLTQLAAFVSICSAQDSLPMGPRSGVEGLYENKEYAYSVVVPRGYVGLRADAPAPSHGFVLQLCKSVSNCTLAIDGSYNTTEDSSLHEIARASVAGLGRASSQLEEVPIQHGGLTGLRYTIAYFSREDGTMRRQTGWVALRRRAYGPSIIYSIILDTPTEQHSDYTEPFDSVLRTFLTIPFGDGREIR